MLQKFTETLMVALCCQHYTFSFVTGCIVVDSLCDPPDDVYNNESNVESVYTTATAIVLGTTEIDS